MEYYQPYLIEYARFIVYFKLSYSELYDKYHSFLEMDIQKSGRVKIREDVQVRTVARIVLNHIIKEYYQPMDN